MVDGLQCTRVEYEQWKHIEEEDGNKRMKIVKADVSKAEFAKVVVGMVSQSKGHADRVREQYAQLKKLKETLPDRQVIAQMDFPENYLHQSCDEV